MKHGIPSYTSDKLNPESIVQIRNLAKSLKSPLLGCDVNLPHVSLLHVVSKAFGYENYNTAQALLGKPETKKHRNQSSTTPARTSGDEYFDRFMNAVRGLLGDKMFEYVMKVRDYTDQNNNPIDTLIRYEFTTYDRLASICAKEFEDINIELFDSAKESIDEFNKRVPFKEELRFNDAEDNVVLFEGAEAVLCVWPTKDEKRKQIIVPLDVYIKLVGVFQKKVTYYKDSNFLECLNLNVQTKVEWYKQLAEERKISSKRFNPKKVALAAMPTEEETVNAIEKTIASVKRSLLISGVSTKEAGRLANWCVLFLGLENVDLNSIVENHYSYEELKKFQSDTSGSIANENAEMYIFAHFIDISPLPFSKDEWKKYIARDSARDHLRSLLRNHSGKRFVSKDLEVIYQADAREAYGILYEFMGERIDNIRFTAIDQALEKSFDDAIKELDEECMAFLNEEEIKQIYSVLWTVQQNAIRMGIEFEAMNFMKLTKNDSQEYVFNKNQRAFLGFITKESLLKIFNSGTESFALSVKKSLPDLIEIVKSEKTIDGAA